MKTSRGCETRREDGKCISYIYIVEDRRNTMERTLGIEPRTPLKKVSYLRLGAQKRSEAKPFCPCVIRWK
jgi:hypothetical protein